MTQSQDKTSPDQTTQDQTTQEQMTQEQTTREQTTPAHPLHQTTREQMAKDQMTQDQMTREQMTREQMTQDQMTPAQTSSPSAQTSANAPAREGLLIPEKTRLELGWPQLLRGLAAQALTGLGKELALELPFLESPQAVEEQLARVAEARFLSKQGQELPLGGLVDVREHLSRAARQGVLEPLALLESARLLRIAAQVRRFLGARSQHLPILAAQSAQLSDFEPLAAEIERAITPEGTVSDSASAELAELRSRSRGLHRSIKGKIEEILADPIYDEVLREKYYSVRADRYVLPVIASHKGRLPGIVHNASQTGQTLFIEPSQLIELGNQLTISLSLAKEEELRILASFSESLGKRSKELLRDLDLLAEFDLVGACARLSDKLGATTPTVEKANAPFNLKGLRHPLLVLREIEVVANDILLQPGKRGLAISGPNAGGKTINLTAVGLCALMLRAGLPIPVAPNSRLPLYNAVLTAIGDEGDLSRDLSTFTAHLGALRDIGKQLLPGTLVCIDEIAAGTDPREGAALASAILDDLVQRDAYVLLTTHFDELKAKALGDPLFASASVEFDQERLAPTYRLVLDRAGSSSAIEIARRVGLPEEICQHARTLLGGSEGALVRTIDALEKERSEVARLTRVLNEEREALASARQNWEDQLQQLKASRLEISASARAEVLAELEKSREQVRQTLSNLQSRPTVAKAVSAQKSLEAEEQRQKAARAKEQAQAAALREQEALDESLPLKVGMRVKVASMGQEAEIVDLGGSMAQLRMGALKLRVPTSDLIPLRGAPKRSAQLRKSAKEREAAAQALTQGSLRSGPDKLDLRGHRVEEALRRLREALDLALREGDSELTVLHGHGTGALKKAIRDELATSPYVEHSRPGERAEGGDAVTLITLKGSTPRPPPRADDEEDPGVLL